MKNGTILDRVVLFRCSGILAGKGVLSTDRAVSTAVWQGQIVFWTTVWYTRVHENDQSFQETEGVFIMKKAITQGKAATMEGMAPAGRSTGELSLSEAAQWERLTEAYIYTFPGQWQC